ncbi:MAG: HlyD family efflux transporter periplasmic adaptor subunit [Chlorobiaceae bacterium]|nr:HlyD family efflux transporter periplasmic adaptor subunit [Chlorobiaceae bacterium]
MPSSVSAKKVAVFSGLIIALATGGFVLWHFFAKPELPEGILSGNGRIEATEYAVSTKIAGRIDSVFVQEGDPVKPGQVLAVMNMDDLRSTLRESEAQVHAAETDLAKARAVSAQQESESLLAEKDFVRYQSLYRQDVVSRQAFDQATAKRSAYAATVKASKAQIAGASSMIEVIRAKSQIVKNNIEDSRLKSPVEGRVLYRISEPGEVIGAGGKVLSVLDLTDVYMTIFLPCEKAGALTIGSEARIVLDAAPGEVIPATVSFISPRAQFTPKEVETRTEREKLMYRIKLKIDPAVLRTNLNSVKTGLTGVAYVRISSKAVWPDNLQLHRKQ